MSRKVVVITGCSEGGIGYYLAKEFAHKGCQVFATARRIEAIGDVEALGIEKIRLDVTDKQSIQSAFEEIITKAGRIDILVNNAGTHSIGAIADVNLDQVRQTIETNVLGALATSQAVIPGMAAQGGGRIVNVGSVVGFTPTPWAGIYSMTKATLHSLSDTMRVELKPFNIDVIVLVPGSIKSNFGDSGEKSVTIPPDSMYASIAHHIRARANASQGPKATPTDVFARRAVATILRSHPPRYFMYGHHTLLFTVLRWIPRAVTEFVMARVFGVGEVKKLKTE